MHKKIGKDKVEIKQKKSTKIKATKLIPDQMPCSLSVHYQCNVIPNSLTNIN